MADLHDSLCGKTGQTLLYCVLFRVRDPVVVVVVVVVVVDDRGSSIVLWPWVRTGGRWSNGRTVDMRPGSDFINHCSSFTKARPFYKSRKHRFNFFKRSSFFQTANDWWSILPDCWSKSCRIDCQTFVRMIAAQV